MNVKQQIKAAKKYLKKSPKKIQKIVSNVQAKHFNPASILQGDNKNLNDVIEREFPVILTPGMPTKSTIEVAATLAGNILRATEQRRETALDFVEGEFYAYSSKGVLIEQKERPMVNNKYRNKKTVVDGITFASKKEAKRYGELKLLEKAGEIKHLQLQVRFPIVVNKIKICTYVTDFTYMILNDGAWDLDAVVEDVKGVRTREYILKKKLMLACHGIEIKEV